MIARCVFLLPLFALTAFADEGSTAVYSVPVADDLREYADFPLKNYLFEETGGELAIEYEMPKALVGTAGVRVVFRGTRSSGENVVELRGDFGTARCEGDHDLDCKIKYENLEIDTAGVRAENLEISRSNAEFNARQSVSDSFASEPIGTIRYEADDASYSQK